MMLDILDREEIRELSKLEYIEELMDFVVENGKNDDADLHKRWNDKFYDTKEILLNNWDVVIYNNEDGLKLAFVKGYRKEMIDVEKYNNWFGSSISKDELEKRIDMNDDDLWHLFIRYLLEDE